MSINKVPIEILEEIFKYILCDSYNSEILDSATVCKAWYIPAMRVFYNNLQIYDPHIALSRLSKQKKNMGVYVKKIRFEDDEEDLDHKKYEQLLSCFPNLKVIDLENSNNREYHLEQLPQHVNLIKHIEDISPGWRAWTDSELQRYFHCAQAWRHSLKCIDLSMLDVYVATSDKKYGKFLSYISDFTAVTHLSIFNSPHERSSNFPQLTMFPIMRSCPNLISFRLINGFREPEDGITTLNFDHSKMKHLNLTLPFLTKYHIDYLVTNLTQLITITLSVGARTELVIEPSTMGTTWKNEIGPEYIDRLGRYLASISKVKFTLFKEAESNNSLLQYWPIIENIINKKPLQSHVYVRLDNLNSNFSASKILVKKDSKDIILNYGLQSSRDILTSESFTLLTLEDIIPFESLANIATVDVQIVNVNEDAVGSLGPYLKLFESAMCKYNSSLYGMNISSNNTGGKFQIKVSSNKADYYSKESYSVYLNRERIPHYEIPATKYKHVFLEKPTLISEDLSIIATSLPSTRYLKVYRSQLKKDDNHNVTLDLKDLDLHELSLDIASLIDPNNSTQTIALQIEETSGSVLNYMWKRDSKFTKFVDFQPEKSSFLKTYNRFVSPKVNVVIIKCQKIQKIKICLAGDEVKNVIQPGIKKKYSYM